MASLKSFWVSIVALLGTLVFVMFISQRTEPIVTKTNLENIPYKLGDYSGTDDYFDPSVIDELNADLHVYRHYRSPKGNQIDLYIGYYGTAKGGRTGHNPYACMPSAGWAITQTDTVFTEYNGKKVGLKKIIAKKGNRYDTVIHWYHSDKNKVMATGFRQNVQRFIGRVFHNRNDGAFVRISIMTGIDGVQQAHDEVIHFTRIILGLIESYWPEEI
jgi:EpsI family protein